MHFRRCVLYRGIGVYFAIGLLDVIRFGLVFAVFKAAFLDSMVCVYRKVFLIGTESCL
jgi:hypothetical protein